MVRRVAISKAFIPPTAAALLFGLFITACGGSDSNEASVFAASSDGAGTSAFAPAPPAAEQAPPAETVNDDEPPFGFDGAFVSLWTSEDVTAIELDSSNTIPIMLPATDLFAPDLFTWDGWPIRNLDGSIAMFDDWIVYVALSADRLVPGSPAGSGGAVGDEPFFTRSEWRYWFTRDGDEWLPGGLVFPQGTPLGSRQWAGSSYHDPVTGRVTFYYTAVGIVPPGSDPTYPHEFPQGNPAEGRPPVIQQMVATSARVQASADGVRFQDFTPHEVILEADGEIYQTFDQFVTDEVIYGMRDPEYFLDEMTGREYILFTANAAFLQPGPFNGVVGLAEKQVDGRWKLLPPLIAAPGVSSQLERPHVLVQDGNYYVFFSTHSFTLNPDGAGPEGLYGFVNTTGNFRGDYQPLNGTGLVAGNPSAKPVQTYSYLALPGGFVMSYLNQAGDVDNRAGWIGSPSPLFQIALDGATTRIVEALTPPGVDGGAASMQLLAPAKSKRGSAREPSATGIEVLERALGIVDR